MSAITKILFALLVATTPIPELAGAFGVEFPDPEPAMNGCQSDYGCANCRYWLGIWTCWGCAGCESAAMCDGDVFSCGAGGCYTESDSCVVTSSGDSCCGSAPNS